MNVTKEQINKAREINLLTYLRSYKPDELMKIGSSYTTKTHGSLRVSENGLWNWFSGGIGGKSALDYLVKVEGVDFVEAVQHLCGIVPNIPFAENVVSTKEKKEFVLPPKSQNMHALFGYLQARGIPREIISECVKRKILFQTSSHGYNNCVFVGMDDKGKPRYASMRGCRGKFRMDIEGSEKKYGFNLLADNQKSSITAVFEAPIDAISGAALEYIKAGNQWKNIHYLSLGGLNYVAMDQFLKTHPQVTTLYLCLDQDQRGRAFTKRMCEKYAEQGLEIVDKPPIFGKDYNDMLCTMTGIEMEKQQEKIVGGR